MLTSSTTAIRGAAWLQMRRSPVEALDAGEHPRLIQRSDAQWEALGSHRRSPNPTGPYPHPGPAHNRDQRVILGGDLNISPQVPSPDAKHHELVIERIKAFGPIDCLGSLPALNRHGFSGGS